ncbi:hypothetical protein BV25DRAFT_1427495 [Artomyces pyxidatus]|uniref:Uncharacterized protein n=1 Tax=Artomyces pyxidatus TaxID=48021 RepID=A0ACB8SLM0_9AGAM|nr:hypothetical protein BV25DRAFT_1427495 [Artomyces pyxidatus]
MPLRIFSEKTRYFLPSMRGLTKDGTCITLSTCITSWCLHGTVLPVHDAVRTQGQAQARGWIVYEVARIRVPIDRHFDLLCLHRGRKASPSHCTLDWFVPEFILDTEHAAFDRSCAPASSC